MPDAIAVAEPFPDAARPRVWRRRASRPRFWLGAASASAMLLAWWAVSGGRVVSADLLPSPGDVAAAAAGILRDGYRGTTLWGNALSTLGRLAGGFGLAALFGIPLGLWMGGSRATRAWSRPRPC